MITIDLVVKGIGVLRYESDATPSVGQTISCLSPMKSWRVLAVDHLIMQRTGLHGKPFHLGLLTVEVEEI